MPVRYLGILIRLPFLPAPQIGVAPGGRIPQGLRYVVLIGDADLEGGAGATCSLGDGEGSEQGV